MPLKHDYQRIAERSLSACDATITANIQEKAAFLAYHAFESTGCALSVHMGKRVGPTVSHIIKIKNFKDAASALGNGKAVAALAVNIGSLRNSFLYPIIDRSTGRYVLPESKITIAQAKELRKRVRGLMKWVGKSI